MNRLFTVNIRNRINEIDGKADWDALLTSIIETKMSYLLGIVSLPQDDADNLLNGFIENYMLVVDDQLSALEDFSKAVGAEDTVSPILHIAVEFFHSVPTASAEHGMSQPMLVLLHQVYLAHRLIEELNDRLMMIIGFPISPYDMNIANLIVQIIIGENFANQLDMAVFYAIEGLLEISTSESQEIKKKYLDFTSLNKDNVRIEWPSFASKHGLTIRRSI